MTMLRARLIVMFVGIVLPYAARLPRGVEWLEQYTKHDIGAWLFLQAFNAVAWGAIVAVSLLYKRPSSVWGPALPGFGFVAFAHYLLDLAADAQSALGLVFIPIYALVPIALGGVAGYVIDRMKRPAAAA